jgi:hypothetical protein
VAAAELGALNGVRVLAASLVEPAQGLWLPMGSAQLAELVANTIGAGAGASSSTC